MLASTDASRTALSSLAAMLVAMSFMGLVFNVASYSEGSTFVEGFIYQNTTWTLAKSPYVVTNDITVVSGTTLTIEHGVEVRFNGSFSLIINGSFYAVGTKDSPIVFTSNSLMPNTGDWNTIKFAGAGNESFNMKNCILEYATRAITVQSLGKTALKNSTVMNNLLSGVHIIADSNVVIEGNTIRQNKNGISSSGNVSSGIKVLNNIIDSNQNGIYLDAVAEGTSEISQINNITISGNSLTSNDNAIYFNVFPRTVGNINNVTISRNIVNFNKNGIYLYIWGGFIAYAANLIYDTIISENLVYSNEKNGIYLYSGGPWLGSVYGVSISSNKIVSNGIGMYLFANTHYLQVEFDVLISNNTVSANIDKGIYVDGDVSTELREGIRTNITRNSISYNAYGVFLKGDTKNIAHFNDVYFNTYGMNVSNDATINASHNFWGDSTGPYHNSLNLDGKGNMVNGDGADLVFEPFLISAVVNKRPTAVLEVDKTEVAKNQVVTFNASKSSDDSRIIRYFFSFGDGTDSGWITQPAASHAYTSFGVYVASLRVVDDLSFESNNSALVTVKVQPTLFVVVSVDFDTVLSDENLIITTYVTDDFNPVSNANVTMSSSKGGVFSYEKGETNSTGHFVSIFTAPSVKEKTTIAITAMVSKTGYWNGQNRLDLNVLPKSAAAEVDFLWVLASMVLTVILISLVFRLWKKKDRWHTE